MIYKKCFRSVFAFIVVIVMAACGGGGGGNSTVETTPATVPRTTKILDSPTLTNIAAISFDQSQITFNSATPQTDALDVGDVIATGVSAAAPSGLLRKVTSIDRSGSEVVVNTTGATIEESIQDGSWTLAADLDSNQPVAALRVASGVRMSKGNQLGKFELAIDNVVLFDEDGSSATTSDQIVANGSIAIEPSYVFSGSVEDYKLKKLTFQNTTKETCSINIASSTNILDAGQSVEIARYVMPTQTIMVGSFPIVMTPILTVEVGLKGNVSAGVSTGIVQEATFTSGLSYEINTGWSVIKEQSKDFTFSPPVVSAAATAKCYAGPKLQLMLYGCAGPYARASGYLKLHADPLSTPWWQLYGGIEAHAGVELKLLSRTVASYSADIFDEQILIAQADGGFTSPGDTTGTVSGRVSMNGNGLSEVAVHLSGPASALATTDASGNYSFSNVANGVYTVTPVKAGYRFYPETRTVTVNGSETTGQDFSATVTETYYALFGTIHYGSNSGPVLSGATVSIAGKTTTTNSSGNFILTGIPSGTYSFVVSKENYQTYTNPAYFVGGDQTGLHFYLSTLNTDPLNSWHVRNQGNGTVLRSVTYGNNRFVTVGMGAVGTSVDGVAWTGEDVEANLYAVAYGGDRFLTAGYAGVVATSADGSSWIPRTTPSVLSTGYLGIAYGNGLFVLGGYGAVSRNLVITADGVSGTGVDSGTFAALNGVTFGNGTFVVVGSTGTILTSQNGTVWTSRYSGISSALSGVAYGNGTFVAVGSTPARILTSSDGVSWMARFPATSNSLYGVTYGNGMFVAVGSGGTIVTSTDGITWRARNSGTTATLNGVTYGSRTFVAVGANGTILQSDPK